MGKMKMTKRVQAHVRARSKTCAVDQARVKKVHSLTLALHSSPLSLAVSEKIAVMNAVPLCISQPILKFPPYPNCFRPSISCINPTRLSCRSSLVIETVEGQPQSQVDPAQVETPSAASDSVSRRLILLRHAMSSWEDRSLRGLLHWLLFVPLLYVVELGSGKILNLYLSVFFEQIMIGL